MNIRKISASLAGAVILTAATSAANAGTYATCLGGVIFTNYGASSPSSLRSCFNERFTPAYLDSVLPALGYTKTGEMTYTSTYKSNDTWLFVIKYRSNTHVSEIVMIFDSGT
jgi:L-asparagine transporter-like permease